MSIENLPNRGKEDEEILSPKSQELFLRQEKLHQDRINAINAGDGIRRRLVEEELDEIHKKLEGNK